MKTRNLLIAAVLTVLTLLTSASAWSESSAPDAYASNYPLQFFAQEIAGDVLRVNLPDIEGDPAYWVPGGEQVAALQAAQLIILNGAGFEGWLDFVTLRPEQLLDTTAGIKPLLLPLEDAVVHQHGPEGEHSHAGSAFTTWLDPMIAIEQSRVIAGALAELAPGQSAAFAQHQDQLEARLRQLDESLSEVFAPLDQAPVFFSHPVYQYLENRYSINGRSLHWEPDTPPGTRAWVDIENQLRDHPARLMIWEAEPLKATRDRLASLGIASVVFEPLGNRPDEGDYFEVMAGNIKRVSAVWQALLTGMTQEP